MSVTAGRARGGGPTAPLGPLCSLVMPLILVGCLKPAASADDFPAATPPCQRASDCSAADAGPCRVAACTLGGCALTARLWQRELDDPQPLGITRALSTQQGSTWLLSTAAPLTPLRPAPSGVRLRHVDTDGRVLRDQTLLPQVAATTLCARRHSSGDLIVAASVGVTGVYWTRLRSDGAPAWPSPAAQVRALPKTNGVQALHLAPDGVGGTLVVGWRQPVDHAPRGWLGRYDADGAHLWSRDLTLGSRHSELHSAVFISAEVGWLVVGKSDGGAADGHGGMDGWAIHVGPDGVTHGEALLGGEGHDELVEVARRDDALVALGRRRSVGQATGWSPWIVRLDPPTTASPKQPSSEGAAPLQVVWSRTLPWRGFADATALTVSETGVFVAGASAPPGDGAPTGRTPATGRPATGTPTAGTPATGTPTTGTTATLTSLALDDGEPQWTRIFGGSGDHVATAILGQDDGELLLAGASTSSTPGGSRLWLRRLDMRGFDACGCDAALDCDDKNPCTNESCDEETGACRHAPISTGLPCEDDALACQLGGTCAAGKCVDQLNRFGVRADVAGQDDAALTTGVALPHRALLAVGWRDVGNKQGSGQGVSQRRGWWARLDAAGAVVVSATLSTPSQRRLTGVSLSRTQPGRAIVIGDAAPPSPSTTLSDCVWFSRISWALDEPSKAVTVKVKAATELRLNAVTFMEREHHAAVGSYLDPAGDQRWLLVVIHDDNMKPTVSYTGAMAGRGAMQAVAYLDGERVRIAGRRPADATSIGVIWTHDHAATSPAGAAQEIGPFQSRWDVAELSSVTALALASAGTMVVAGPKRGGVAGDPATLVMAISAAGKALWTQASALPDHAALSALRVATNPTAIDVLGRAVAGQHSLSRLGPNGALLRRRSLTFVSDLVVRAVVPSQGGLWLLGERSAGSLHQAWLAQVDRWGNHACHGSCLDPSQQCDDGSPCQNLYCDASAGACVSGGAFTSARCQ